MHFLAMHGRQKSFARPPPTHPKAYLVPPMGLKQVCPPLPLSTGALIEMHGLSSLEAQLTERITSFSYDTDKADYKIRSAKGSHVPMQERGQGWL